MYGRSRHKYFLKSDEYFQQDHTADDYFFSGGLQESDIDGTKFDDLYTEMDSALEYYNGYWYGLDGNEIKQYTASDNGLKEIKTIKIIDQLWYVLSGEHTG